MDGSFGTPAKVSMPAPREFDALGFLENVFNRDLYAASDTESLAVGLFDKLARPWPLRAIRSADTHFSCALFENNGPVFRRDKEHWTGAIGVVLDDIGETKNGVLMKAPPVEPTAIIETKPGSCQWVYLFNGIERDREVVDTIQRSAIAGEMCDPGAGTITRITRLPGSLPEGKEHKARIVWADWTRRFDPRSIIEDVFQVPRVEAPKTPARPANMPLAPPSPAYGEATLRGEIERLKAAPQGTRNAALNIAALKLGQLVPDGHLSESLIIERLTEAAAGIGLDAVETGATIKSGMSKGMTEPRGPGGDALARLGAGPGDYVPAGMLLEPVQVVHRTAPAFTFVAVGDLEARPPAFLIDGLMETDTLGLIFGDPGCGKSFIAADMALSVATGEPFHGRPTKQGPVFFIAGEGHSGLARRFQAWARHRGRGLDGVPMFKSNRAAQFLDTASAQAVADAVDALVSAHGAPRMIVVDTLARNFGPGDENSTSEMGAFVAAMDDLRGRHPGCVVLIVHHSGHGDKLRMRGSMALKGAIEFEYRAEKSDGTITLTNIKMKDAPLAAPMAFRLQGVPLADGASSAAMVPTVAPEGRGKLKPNEKVALKAFKAAADEQDGWDNGLHLIQWSDAFLKIHTGTNPDSKRRMFGKARGDLVEKGIVSVEHDIYKINGSLPLNSDGLPDFSGFVRTNPAVQGGLSGLPPIGESRIRHSGPHMPGIN